MTGVAAAAWIAGLLLAAPLLRATPSYGLGDRLRDALILGIALPALAGVCHALYAPVLWVLLVLAVAAAFIRGMPQARSEPVALFTLATLAAIAWPALIRPVLDGDTLAYHLPNAASWANAHSLYTNVTRYWWYPPASELFASALYSVAGPFSVAWSGALTLAFAGVRVRDWYLRTDPSRAMLADLAGAAFVTMIPLAWQAGSLQNDVWLAAFAFEAAVVTAGNAREQLKAAIVTVFLKPFGWIFGLGALLRRPILLVVPTVLLALWALRDVLLAPSAVTPIIAAVAGNTWGSTIAAHAPGTLWLTAQSFFFNAPLAGVAFLAALLIPLVRLERSALSVLAFSSAVLFFFLPYTYDNGVAQLALGWSLRYASVAMLCGFALMAPYATRYAGAARVVFALAALYGAGIVIQTFSNDIPTRSAVIVALLVAALGFAAQRMRSPLPLIGAGVFAIVLAVPYAARTTITYVQDATAFGLMRSNIYGFLAANKPPRLVAVGVRGGSLLLVDPQAAIIDADDANGCAAAKALHAELVTFDENGRSVEANMERQRNARRCGSALASDPMSSVISPR